VHDMRAVERSEARGDLAHHVRSVALEVVALLHDAVDGCRVLSVVPGGLLIRALHPCPRLGGFFASVFPVSCLSCGSTCLWGLSSFMVDWLGVEHRWRLCFATVTSHAIGVQVILLAFCRSCVLLNRFLHAMNRWFRLWLLLLIVNSC
jgi:hypothetical protein